jgi:hypothetical protein
LVSAFLAKELIERALHLHDDMLHFYSRIFGRTVDQTIWFWINLPGWAPHKHPIGSITDFASGGFVCRNRFDRGGTAAKVQCRRPNCSRGFNKLFSSIPSTPLFGTVSGSGIPHRSWRVHLGDQPPSGSQRGQSFCCISSTMPFYSSALQQNACICELAEVVRPRNGRPLRIGPSLNIWCVSILA